MEKFNVGDRIRMTQAGPTARVGELGTVKSVSGDLYLVHFDEFNARRGRSDMSQIPRGHAKMLRFSSIIYRAEKVPATRTSGKTWIIIVVENGKLAPAKNPVEYKSAGQARKVAHEMAEKHPGNEFYVFEAIGMAKAVKTTYAPF